MSLEAREGQSDDDEKPVVSRPPHRRVRLGHEPLVAVALVMLLGASGMVVSLREHTRFLYWTSGSLLEPSLWVLTGALGALVVAREGLPRWAVWSGLPVASMIAWAGGAALRGPLGAEPLMNTVEDYLSAPLAFWCGGAAVVAVAASWLHRRANDDRAIVVDGSALLALTGVFLLLLGRSVLILDALIQYDDLLAGGLDYLVAEWARHAARWEDLWRHMLVAVALSGCALAVLIGALVRRRASGRSAGLLAALSLLVGLVFLSDLLSVVSGVSPAFRQPSDFVLPVPAWIAVADRALRYAAPALAAVAGLACVRWGARAGREGPVVVAVAVVMGLGALFVVRATDQELGRAFRAGEAAFAIDLSRPPDAARKLRVWQAEQAAPPPPIDREPLLGVVWEEPAGDASWLVAAMLRPLSDAAFGAAALVTLAVLFRRARARGAAPGGGPYRDPPREEQPKSSLVAAALAAAGAVVASALVIVLGALS